MLDAYKGTVLKDLQVNYVPVNVDQSTLSLGNNFLNTLPLFKSSRNSLGVIKLQ